MVFQTINGETMSELVMNGLLWKHAELVGEIEHTRARLRTLVAEVGSFRQHTEHEWDDK